MVYVIKRKNDLYWYKRERDVTETYRIVITDDLVDLVHVESFFESDVLKNADAACFGKNSTLKKKLEVVCKDLFNLLRTPEEITIKSPPLTYKRCTVCGVWKVMDSTNYPEEPLHSCGYTSRCRKCGIRQVILGQKRRDNVNKRGKA